MQPEQKASLRQFYNQLADAADAYRESLQLRRQLKQRLGETPEVVCDLSISLDRVEDVARAQDRLDDAAALWDEALMWSRRLNLAFPDVQAHRDMIETLQMRLAAIGTADDASSPT